MIERLWRSIKYEEVYLHAYKTVPEARAGISRYLAFYNTRRPHSSLDRQTPDQALLQCADANPGGSIIEAEIHLSTRRNRSDKPSHLSTRNRNNSRALARTRFILLGQGSSQLRKHT